MGIERALNTPFSFWFTSETASFQIDGLSAFRRKGKPLLYFMVMFFSPVINCQISIVHCKHFVIR